MTNFFKIVLLFVAIQFNAQAYDCTGKIYSLSSITGEIRAFDSPGTSGTLGAVINTIQHPTPISAAPNGANALGYSNATNKFYYVLNQNGGGSTPNTFVSFDPSTGTYENLASTNGFIYRGTVTNDGLGYYGITSTNVLKYYDIVNNTWTNITNNYVDQNGQGLNSILNTYSGGDIAMDGNGDLWILAGTTSSTTAFVFRVKSAVPKTNMGGAPLVLEQIVKQDIGAIPNGISFNSAGELFITNATTLFKMNSDFTISSIGTISNPTNGGGDLASCAYPTNLFPVSDYGDAPDSYSTLSTSNGPRHSASQYDATNNTASLMIGSKIDLEDNAFPNTNANGDDTNKINDENSVAFPVLNSVSSTYTATIPVVNATGTGATLRGWIDFNKNGTFEASESASVSVADGETSVSLTWTGLSGITIGSTYYRLRIAKNAADINLPTGSVFGGEVEDGTLNIITVDAVNDVQTITVGSTGTTSVLNNDTLNGSPASLTNVNLTQTNTTNPGVTLDTATGLINIAVGTPLGTYIVTYQICDKSNPTICDTATVEVSVSVPVGTPFSCPGSNDLYLSQGPDETTGTQLQYIGRNNNPFDYVNIGGISHGITYNAIGYNQLDNFIYGINQSGGTSNKLVRVDSAGEVVDFGSIAGLPVEAYISGDMIGGDLYVIQAGGVNRVYKINVASKSVTEIISLSNLIETSDIAYNSVTGLFYGVISGAGSNRGKLFSINPSTGAVTFIGAVNNSVLRFGAMYSDFYGNVYGNENGGGFYQFDLTNGFRTKLSNSPSALVNDGAVCTNITFSLGADLLVSKTSPTNTFAPGSTVTYTIVARNNGPFGVANASVVDNVPTGIPTSNVTYTAVASSGSSTSVTGTQIGNINDLVNLPVNGTVTYTVTVQVPISFVGNLVNTVKITSPNNSTDPNPSNDTDTYTHTQGVCYENPGTSATAVPVKQGITVLGRAGKENGNWPMNRNSAYTALESKTKGFVITRMTSDPLQPSAANHLNKITNPVIGMMVFDTYADSGKGCLKINTDGTSTGWKCFNKQSCP